MTQWRQCCVELPRRDLVAADAVLLGEERALSSTKRRATSGGTSIALWGMGWIKGSKVPGPR
jgi:hypothetical protein